jgi:hypothetical protein
MTNYEYKVIIKTDLPLSDWEQAELEQNIVDFLSPGEGSSVSVEEVVE